MLKTISCFLKMLNIELSYDPIIQLPMYRPKRNQNMSMQKLIFIEALFIIAKKYKQPKCPSTNEYI